MLYFPSKIQKQLKEWRQFITFTKGKKVITNFPHDHPGFHTVRHSLFGETEL